MLGVFSRIYREYANNLDKIQKWIIFDGPLDCNWTDRLTTVLDKNRKLCLVSGEIIPVYYFEINKT